MKKENILYLVIPCYNEEPVLAETTSRLTDKMERMIKAKLVSPKSKIMYVDDGSKDGTWTLIEKLHKDNKFVEGVKLAKNRGHQNALLAGLMTAKEYADILISMDADLQDDVEVLDDFIKEYDEGSEIVYGVRSSRKKDTFFKRNTAQLFYKLMTKLGVDVVYNHADYRLMSKRAVNELEKYSEVNLFLRGIIPQIGLKTSTVEYERKERFAGESKYPLKKMLGFALEGVLSFSVSPLRIITILGLLISFISFVFLIYVIVGHFVNGNVAGWTTTVALVCFFGGFQILCMGVIGEYIGKIYSETKRRPRYSIEKILSRK
ncbi:glycosyltransferase family 2 protein [Candidatus Saccharibacteria bacterium]|nr:glycosyltransferase family 2 protein [Candidatus Saccharibacteria bacterium]